MIYYLPYSPEHTNDNVKNMQLIYGVVFGGPLCTKKSRATFGPSPPLTDSILITLIHVSINM